MSNVRIEAYISVRNFVTLEEIRQKLQNKGYSAVLNHIIGGFMDLKEKMINVDKAQDTAINRLNMIIMEKVQYIKRLEDENKQLQLKVLSYEKKKVNTIKKQN